MPLQLNITQVLKVWNKEEEATIASRNLNIYNNSTLQLFLTRSNHYFSITFWNVPNIYHKYHFAKTNLLWILLQGFCTIFKFRRLLSVTQHTLPFLQQNHQIHYILQNDYIHQNHHIHQNHQFHQNHQNDQIYLNHQIHLIPLIIAFLYVGNTHNSLLVCGEGKSRS